MDLDKYNLWNPWTKDRIYYFIDFSSYAAVTGKAWRLPFNFKIQFCVN